MTALDIKRPTETKPDVSRRKLVKRLALVAAAGYLAPKAVMISEPWACDKANMPAPHGGCTSGPFC